MSSLSPLVFKETVSDISVVLTFIYNQSLSSGTIPADWRMANIFALHEKGPKDLAEDYRPISLTSVCCKTLEHIVYSNVCKFLDSNNILTPKQHGFRPGFSCETVKHSSFFLSTIGPGPWIPASVVMLPSSISVRPLTLFLIPDFLASCIILWYSRPNAYLVFFFFTQPLSTSCCTWISVILVRCDLGCPAGHSARAITFPTLY